MDNAEAMKIMALYEHLAPLDKLEVLKTVWRASPKVSRDNSMICIVSETEIPNSEHLAYIWDINEAGKEIGYGEQLRLAQVFQAGVICGKRAERQRRKAAIQREG